MTQNDQGLLTRLRDQCLEFVVIGGVCVVYHGVPMATFDLDICCPFDETNLKLIEAAVADLHPVHRLTSNKLPLESTRNRFADMRNLYLHTDWGKLDCLSEVAGVGNYGACLGQSVLARFSFGEFRFLNLDALIASKEATRRDHDLAAVKRLRAVRERLRQSNSQGS